MTSKHYLELLKKDLQAKTQFQNSLDNQKLESMNLYQKSTEVQKPLINEVNKIVEAIKEQPKKVSVTDLQPNTSYVENILRTSIGKSYSLIQTGKTIESNALNVKFDEWKFNSDAKSNVGKFVLMKRNGIDYIWNFKLDNKGIPLTPGLEEILFNDGTNKDIITPDDIEDWQYLINSAGLSSVYDKSNIAKKLQKKPKIEEVGDGISSFITIPSNPDELREQLALQLAAMKAGHKNTFNHANGIMQELMKQKKMTSKEYRNILKNIYDV